MQKIINIISCVSFSAVLAGACGLTLAFLNQETIKNKIISEVTKSLPIPELPNVTGPATPKLLKFVND